MVPLPPKRFKNDRFQVKAGIFNYISEAKTQKKRHNSGDLMGLTAFFFKKFTGGGQKQQKT